MTRIHIDRYRPTPAPAKALQIPEGATDDEMREATGLLYEQGFTALPMSYLDGGRKGIAVFRGKLRNFVPEGNFIVIGGQFDGQTLHPSQFAEHFDPTPLED